ncbi:cupin domain-containing protein [Pseudomonas sp. TH05]|uniref:cupin domain-containing protein n=1 Tax=unclassified Pseudomonas TaxID=196821 RepID=UPI0019144602|nr:MULTISPECIES: cupin domain-containing protein [unclassified Pseudomonas]MBK5540941.1 cupin domain-containing protein [Pseudomonas sp. TH07]MBK5560209.1 cupin domain-containing protein [Pseudomonas sp. TH05]
MNPLTAALAALALLTSLGAAAHEPVYGQEKLAILQEQALSNMPGKKALMLTVDYAPGQATVPHRHAGAAMAYVLQGAITSRVNDQPAITYKAGQSWFEPAGSRHPVSSNASQTEPAKLLVFMLMDEQDAVLTPLEK